MEWFVLALLPRSRNRLVELDSRCRFVDWLLERGQSVNDCNEQKECDLKGNERRRGFRKKSTSLVTIFGDDDSHSEMNWHRLMTVVVVLPDPFRGMGARRNYAVTQQSGHTPRSGPQIENRERGAKDRFAKGFRSTTVEEEMIEVL